MGIRRELKCRKCGVSIVYDHEWTCSDWGWWGLGLFGKVVGFVTTGNVADCSDCHDTERDINPRSTA